jgi:hypothetical protein
MFVFKNMIDKTMYEVLWRNISDFYVNLRVEVEAVSRNRYGVEKTVDTHTILINAIQYYVCLQEIW